MGSYLNEKINAYQKKGEFYSYDLNKLRPIIKEKLLVNLNKKKYSKFIKENINANGATLGKETIIKEIENFYKTK